MDGSDSMHFVVGLPSVMCQPGAFALLWPLHGPPGTGSIPDDRGNDWKRGEPDLLNERFTWNKYNQSNNSGYSLLLYN